MTIVNLVDVTAEIAISGKIAGDGSLKELLSVKKGWLYLNPDEGEDVGLEPGGYEALQKAAAGESVSTQKIPINHKVLTLAVAKECVAAISSLPRPLLISCRSNARAGAVLTIWHAEQEHLGPEAALEYATSHEFTFLKNASLLDWVVAAVASATHRLPPLFRQLFEAESSTYTYILADPKTRDAVIIDPVDLTVDRDVQLLNEMDLRCAVALNTHCHADHVTGTGLLKQKVAGLKSAISEASGARADIKVRDGEKIRFGDYYLEVRATPGHTNGCVSYVLDDRSMVFTGDRVTGLTDCSSGGSNEKQALLIRGCGRTDFQEGDSRKLYQSVHERIFSLPNDAIVYPAHDYKGRTASSVGEEKAHNPRLTKTVDEFVEIMANLNLPYPKKIDQSLPLNLVCGVSD